MAAVTIDELAAVVRACLDADWKAASDLLHAARIPDKVPNFFAAGGPAAEALWQRCNENRVLREVAAKRALLDKLLAEHGHGVGCEVTRPHGPCNCGADARTRAYLELLAQPYQEAT